MEYTSFDEVMKKALDSTSFDLECAECKASEKMHLIHHKLLELLIEAHERDLLMVANEMIESGLVHCPCCGKTPTLYRTAHMDRRTSYRVGCSCGMTTFESHTVRAAVNVWNRRTNES